MQFLNFQEGQFINFLAFRRIAAIISGILILAGIVSVTLHKGLKYGIDFRGGTNVQIQFTTLPNLDQLRKLFAEQGMKNVVLQTFGSRALRLPPYGSLNVRISRGKALILEASMLW